MGLAASRETGHDFVSPHVCARGRAGLAGAGRGGGRRACLHEQASIDLTHVCTGCLAKRPNSKAEASAATDAEAWRAAAQAARAVMRNSIRAMFASGDDTKSGCDTQRNLACPCLSCIESLSKPALKLPICQCT